MHRVLIETMVGSGEVCRIEGEEARHAVRVKRLEPGEPVELLDGRGRVARGSVRGSEKSGGRGEWALLVDVHAVEERPRVHPAVHVLAASPKGDRLEEMIDGLSQVGAASWGLLRTARGVGEPREHRLERLERIARESAKQCGRAWALELAEPVDVDAAVRVGEAGTTTIMADAGGKPFVGRGSGASALATVRLLIGPEGGWTAEELELGRGSGAAIHRFGPHVMRIEQAAVVAAAIVLHETA